METTVAATEAAAATDPAEVVRAFLTALEAGDVDGVHFHTVAADGGTVLTERTDALGVGRFEQRFWLYGRFEVEDGRITVWRDSFDWLDLGVSLVRALGGMLVPAVNRRWPGRAT